MEEMKNEKLSMYGGIWGGMVPLLILVVGLVWLSVAERGGTKLFWACGWLALAGGLFFAKNKTEYCKAVMRGIGNETGIVIVTAWLFAGVFGKIMAAGGLVNGLLWIGMSTGAQEGIFTMLVFVIAMLFSLGTGTSTGTCLSLTPVLYPAGVYLGCVQYFWVLPFYLGLLLGTTLLLFLIQPLFLPIHKALKCGTLCAAVSRWQFQQLPLQRLCSLFLAAEVKSIFCQTSKRS